MSACPLCLTNNLSDYFSDAKRDYCLCSFCSLVSVPANQQLSAEAEKAEYDKHNNDPNDAGYRQFLNRTLKPLITQLEQKYSDYKSNHGLDFGCGPGPTLSLMAAEQSIKVSNYDLYYFNQPELLTRQYDFITLTEVIEHLAKPIEVIKQLDKILKAGGILAIMTKRVIDKDAFSQWHYKNDPTHISFFSEATFAWIAQEFGWRLQVIDKDVVFFHKD